ncbi:MAG: DUF6799 domain-containing protein [Ferruginibacter sp.]
MKKLIRLSVAAMFSLAITAQDTSLNRGSVPPANMQDTIPGNRSQKDSSSWKNNTNNKRAIDSTLDQRSDSSKLNRPDTSATVDSRTTPGDSSLTNTATPDLRSNKSSQDTLASSNSTSQKTQADSSSASSSATAEVETDRIVMRNDSLLIIQNGTAATLDKDYKLQSGAIVSSGGSVKFPSGKTVQLKNGQFIELIPADDSNTDKTKSKKSKKGKKTKTEE